MNLRTETQQATQFKKGVSGNPGGRPKAIKELQEAARELTFEAIEVLRSIATSSTSPAAARVSAACALLDRAWGKPSQSVSLEAKELDQIQPVVFIGRKLPTEEDKERCYG